MGRLSWYYDWFIKISTIYHNPKCRERWMVCYLHYLSLLFTLEYPIFKMTRRDFPLIPLILVRISLCHERLPSFPSNKPFLSLPYIGNKRNCPLNSSPSCISLYMKANPFFFGHKRGWCVGARFKDKMKGFVHWFSQC